MSRGTRPRRRAGVCLPVALALACAVAPGSAPAAASRPTDGDLSPRLAELAKPAVRSAPPAKQARQLSVARSGPGSLLREGNRVLIEVRFTKGAAAGVDDLRAAGAKIVHVSPRYQTVTVAAKPSELRRLSAVPRVAGATEVLTPIVHASSEPGPVTSAITPCFGAATSEGDVQLHADQARAEFGVDGSGVKVGVLSDSFDRDSEAATSATEDVESGDLPGPGNRCERETPVQVLDDSETEGADEGRGMAQIVHDLAPGADLAFATAFSGLTAFADRIRELRDEGAGVIVDDVSYFVEPFFQEGPIGVAAGEVTESGVTYFSSAGNNNLINGGKDIASWEASEFRDSGACPAAVVALSEEFEEFLEPGLNPSHCMDFDPGPGTDRTFRLTVSPGATAIIDLQWAEAWEGVDTDIDVFLVDSEGEVVAGSVDDNVFGTQRPFEFLGWENETGSPANVQLVINRYSGKSPRLKLALLQNGGGVTSTEYQSSAGGDVVGPTIFGHNGAEAAVSVGAVKYNTTTAPEAYSSRGPVTHYFDPVGGSTPAEPAVPEKLLAKPDIAATDCGVTTFFVPTAEPEVFRFCGTSAAAPHAAAVAALMLQEKGTATPAEIEAGLRESAVSVGSFGPCAVGAGLVDAVGAIEYLLNPEPGPSESCEAPESAPIEEGEAEEDDDSPSSGGSTGSAPAPVVAPVPVDVVAPQTFIQKRPQKVVLTPWRRGRAVFRFRSNEPGVLFICRFDRKSWRRCGPRFVRWFRVGRHVLRVRTRDAAGNVDPTPAVYRFRVRRVSKEQFARFNRTAAKRTSSACCPGA